MKLVIDGIGRDSVDYVKRVEFVIAQVSADPGLRPVSAARAPWPGLTALL